MISQQKGRPMTRRKLLTVGGVAKAAGLHPDTIRSYVREGLLKCERDSAGRRLFSLRAVAAAQRIAAKKAKRWSKGKGEE